MDPDQNMVCCGYLLEVPLPDACNGYQSCFHGEIAIITKTRLYNFDPLKPHFYIVKLGFTGIHFIFLILLKKHRLWVLVRNDSLRQF